MSTLLLLLLPLPVILFDFRIFIRSAFAFIVSRSAVGVSPLNEGSSGAFTKIHEAVNPTPNKRKLIAVNIGREEGETFRKILRDCLTFSGYFIRKCDSNTTTQRECSYIGSYQIAPAVEANPLTQ